MDEETVIDVKKSRSFFKKMRNSVVVLIAIALLVLIGFNSWYIVEPDENGVIFTLGKVTSVNGPGLHFKLPYPLQKVEKPKVTKVNRVEIGFRTIETPQEGEEKYLGKKEEALMVTGDLNIVDNEYIIQYRISDPVKYLLEVEDPDATVKKAAESAMREVVASTTIDAVLTDGKVKVQNDAKEKLQQILDHYGVGIQVVAVQLQDVYPPEEVKPAFSAVVDALETKNQKINKAREYENKTIPAAEGQAQQMLENAMAEKIQRIENAKGDAAKFNSLYEGYSVAEEVTKTRLYFEMLQAVLPQMEKIYIVDSEGNTVTYLPLDPTAKGAKIDE